MIGKFLQMALDEAGIDLSPYEVRHGCFDLGGGQSGSTQTTVSNRPIPAVEDALGRLLPQAEALANTPVEQPGFDTVVPFSEQTENSLQLQEARALGGSPLEQGAQNVIQQTLNGDFLQRENPGFQQFADRITGDIGANINSQFAGAGRLGSQANSQALGRGIGDALAPLQFQQFQAERQNQLGAAQFAPQLAQIDFNNINQLGQVGAAREGQLGSQLQDQLNRFNFAQQEPRSRIAEVLALIGGGQFGQNQTQTSPIFSNPLASGLGAASSAASIASSLFGSSKGGTSGFQGFLDAF